jgi:NAD(P)-dependent dehydrogenase (short-subunit alcohol dehydrogenase family)
VADDAAVIRWAKSVLVRSGPPDLLINNAALINRNARLRKIRAAEFYALVEVNMKGVANTIHHFVPSMAERGRGIILNFSSGWRRETGPEVAPYYATKWAKEGLSKALAQELPKGIAAVPLSPVIIDTNMLRSCFGSDAGLYPSPEVWAKTPCPTSCHWVRGTAACP